jgi:hypothetical protein
MSATVRLAVSERRDSVAHVIEITVRSRRTGLGLVVVVDGLV